MIITIPAQYALLIVVPLWIVARAVTYFLDRRPRESIRCRQCWYDLRGNTTNKCPECGADIHKVGAWWHGHPNRRRWVNRVGLWMALCAIPTAYTCNWYEYHSTTIPGMVDIRAMVDKPKNMGVMAFIEFHSVKLPLIPNSSFIADEVCYTVIVTRGTEYSLFAEGDPLFVDFDIPRTLTPGMQINISTLEQATAQAIPQTLPDGFSEAIVIVSAAVDRLVVNGKLALDLQDVEQAVHKIHDEFGSPESYELKVEANTRYGGIGSVPKWTKWLPTIPMSIIWFGGVCIITRHMRRRGVVWTLPGAAE